MRPSIPWGLLLPPLFSLLIAFGIVAFQSSRHKQVATELASAKSEITRLMKLLPEEERNQFLKHSHERSVEECKDPH